MGIYVWGTGCGASELLSAGLDPKKISAFIDSFPSKKTFMKIPVLLPEELDISDCELMIITARESETITNRCLQLGLSGSRLFYLKNSYQLTDRNEFCTFARPLLGEKLCEKLRQPHRCVPVPHGLKNTRIPDRELNNDYIRLASLELLCRRLEKIPGNAAELGVYRGNFAGILNRLMPERKLYLFDTFEGFEETEGRKEKEHLRCTDAFLLAHKNTSIQQVLAKLPYPDQAVFCPGLFPASAKEILDQFCLVSLDADFEDTTYEGLSYFWPQISRGGYLLLHDWNSPNLSGVKTALERFEKELGHPIPSVPLCDIGGTLVLCKQ